LLQLELLGRVKVSLQATATTITATVTATTQRLLELRALFLAQGIDSLL
jgi:hypothetical protein